MPPSGEQRKSIVWRILSWASWLAAASSADTLKNNSWRQTPTFIIIIVNFYFEIIQQLNKLQTASCIVYVTVQTSRTLDDVLFETHGVSPQEDLQRVGGVLQLELHQQAELQQLNTESCRPKNQRHLQPDSFQRKTNRLDQTWDQQRWEDKEPFTKLVKFYHIWKNWF